MFSVILIYSTLLHPINSIAYFGENIKTYGNIVYKITRLVAEKSGGSEYLLSPIQKFHNIHPVLQNYSFRQLRTGTTVLDFSTVLPIPLPPEVAKTTIVLPVIS